MNHSSNICDQMQNRDGQEKGEQDKHLLVLLTIM